MNPRDRQILHIALPSIVSNITVPLLGLVDVAIVGHLGAPAYIGAIAVGGMLFNIIYWMFAFLRMGTSGMTAQAWGSRDLPETVRLLIRAVGIGWIVALGLIVLQEPIRQGAFLIIRPTEEVALPATRYFRICIYGAPAMLGLYGLTGWFVGMQNTRIPMLVAITQNVMNIAASLILVFGCGLKVEGVALGTLIAQYGGLFMAIGLGIRYYGRLGRYVRLQGRHLSVGRENEPSNNSLWQRDAMSRFFQVNRDIFLRTVCIASVTLYSTSAGAMLGDIILAANTLLMQLFLLFSYIMDGFAFAGEALSGRYIGARNERAFHETLRRLFVWGGGSALLFSFTYGCGGVAFLSLLTDEQEVINAASRYFGWAIAIPIVGVTAFIWDGIFIGATATRGMLVSMASAAATFFVLYFSLRTPLGNHALWLAFVTYLFMRGAVQSLLAGKVIREAFPRK